MTEFLSDSWLAVAVGAGLLLGGCKREPSSIKSSTPASDTLTFAHSTPASSPAPSPRVVSTREGVATWYDPPANSPPVRRAPGEFTAAYNRLPIGSRVNVVNLHNGRSVTVRITDDGVPNKEGIDLCKSAAEEIGLIGAGKTKVRIEQFQEHPEASAP